MKYVEPLYLKDDSDYVAYINFWLMIHLQCSV